MHTDIHRYAQNDKNMKFYLERILAFIKRSCKTFKQMELEENFSLHFYLLGKWERQFYQTRQ